MGKEVLSQTEVESLLNTDASEKEFAGSTSISRDAETVNLRADEATRRYDFKRPDRISKPQFTALEKLHRPVATHFASGLSALLRSKVTVELKKVEQIGYHQLVMQMAEPTCLNLLREESLDENLLLEMAPSVLSAMIDRMLGSSGPHRTAQARPLTRIELRLAMRITNLFLDELRKAWAETFSCQLQVVRVAESLRNVQLVEPEEAVVRIQFHVALDGVGGIISLCVPCKAVGSIFGSCECSQPAGNPSSTNVQQSQEPIVATLRSSTVEMQVDLAKMKIDTGELVGLAVGDIIATDEDVQSPLTVSVEGVPKFRGRPGAHKGRLAVRIESVIDQPFQKKAG